MKRSSLVIIACVGAVAVVTGGVAMHVRRSSAAATSVLISPRDNEWPIVKSSNTSSALSAAVNADFEQLMLKIAADYKRFGRVDHTMRPAPGLCSAPAGPSVYSAISQSSDKSTHGRKLYTLFASDVAAYRSLGSSGLQDDGGVGQTIVKESWSAVPFDANAQPPHPDLAPVTDHGFTYQAGEQRDLFIMARLDPSTPGTDDGWIYGTVTPDGKHVTSAGRVQSCMNCHVDAPHGRLFGLRDTQTKAQ